jgi:hypothetical protein
VTIIENQGSLVPGSATLHYDIGLGFQSVPLSLVSPGNFLASFPASPCGAQIQFYLSGDSTLGGTWTFPEGGSVASAVAGNSLPLIASEDMEASNGWTSGVGGDNATTGLWTRVNPVGTSSQPEDDHSASGTRCWVTGQGSVGGSLGSDDVDGGQTTLQSAAYDASALNVPTLSYWRWYSNDGNGTVDDDFVVQVSNGGAWIEVERLGPGHAEASGGWFQHSFLVTDFVTASNSIRLRFIADDSGSGSIVEAAIDDLELNDVECGPCSGTTVSSYCNTSANSAGPGALIGSTGSTSVSANDFVLEVFGSVPSVPGIFFYGASTNAAPLGNGTLCVSGAGSGIFRLNPAQFSDGSGDSVRPLDLTSAPADSGPGKISVGETWYFQFWYRDQAAGGAGFNLSNALSVIFCP